jgi:hypothetical protein
MIMTDPIGFVVHGVITDSETYFHVIGRCGDSPIFIGDEFNTVYSPATPKSPDDSRFGQPRSVKLKVERIQAYQNLLPELSGGMTGTIDLRGQGLDCLVPGAVLGSPVRIEVGNDSSHEATTSRESRS